MQKKLIALAIAGLSGAAFAQSNVTVYGQVNMAYENMSGTRAGNTAGALPAVAAAGSVGTTATQSRTRLAALDSRIGFMGEEGLGNGMKAVFTLEYNITPDEAGANTASNVAGATGLNANARQTFAGLKGNFGSVTFGRQYTPFFDAAAAIDPFGVSTGQVGSAARINPIAAIARADNSFKYVSPMIGGNFLVAGLIGLSEKAATNAVNGDAGKIWNWKVAYVNGPILAGITQIKLTDQAAGVTAVAFPAIGATTKATAIGGTYDMKVVKLHILNDRVKVDNANGIIADRNDWMFGISAPVGGGTLKVQYSKVDERADGAAAVASGYLAAGITQSANDASHIGIGYYYPLSKRTTLMANYGKVSNKGDAAFDIGAGASGAGTLGLTNAGAGNGAGYTTAYQLGMLHSF